MRGARSHFLLLFLKNLKLLVRAPVTLVCEIFIPIIIVIMFYGISTSFPTLNHCFSTYSPKSNDLRIPPYLDVMIAIAPSTQRVRDIIDAVMKQDQVDIQPLVLDFLESEERVNTILKTSPSTYIGAVIFDDFHIGDDHLPDNISYTIRYPIKTSIGKLDWVGKSPGPDDWECATGDVGLCVGKKVPTERKFLKEWQFQLQQAIDRAIIHLKTNTPLSDITEVKARQLPFPQWIENWFLVGLSEGLPIMIIIGFFWNVFITTKDIAKDRDTGVREIFKSIGVSNSSILGSWHCLRLLVAVTVVTVVTFFLWALQITRFSNMFLVWIIMVLFAVSTVNMCFLMGTFISSSTLGMFTILISYLVSFTPFLVLAQNTDQHSDTTKYFCALLSPAAVCLALANVGTWEAEGIGLTWDTLNQCTGPSDFTALTAIMMMVVDSVIYGVFFVYLDEIFPGKHGIGLHWTYIFEKKYWTSRLPNDGKVKEDDERGVELEGVEKHYFSRGRITRAVNGISTKFRENEISTLLGYNGSGKTTTLKMLAAMHSPTSGKITINGLDLSNNASTIRKTLGYCPQHNILIEDLSVIEHLQLFTSLKGLHGKHRDVEIEMSIKKLRFEEHRDDKVQHLSGGMKRKLSLGLALCGHPNVVILDEPTCGMDTDARRVTWELLLNHRQGRTIIVSTHDMEEADLLSDRCFVLSEGRIISSGSSTNIKSLNGVGYQLSVSVISHDKQLLPVLQQFAPDARLIRKSYKEQVFAISDADKVSLIKLLKHLEVEGGNLGITGYGLLQSDLEEALANVIKTQTREPDRALEGERKMGCFTRLTYWMFGVDDDVETFTTLNNKQSVSYADQNQYAAVPLEDERNSPEKYSGFMLSIARLVTLIKKRILDDRRNKLGIVMKLVIPFLLILFGITFLKINQKAEQFKYTLDIDGLAKQPDYLLTVDLAQTGIFRSDNKLLSEVQNFILVDWTKEIKESISKDYKNIDCCSYSFLQLQDTCANLQYNSSVWQNCMSNPSFGYSSCFDACFQRDVLMDYQGCSAGQRPGENSQTQIDYFQNKFLNRSVDYLFKKYHHHVLTSSAESGEVSLTAWFSAMRRHSIAQSVNVMNNMLVGYYSNNTAGTITTSFWPYETLEDSLTQASEVSLPLMIMAMFTTFAGTFVTASISLFLVKERVTKMKHLQLMAGISGRIYWYANLLWDHCVFLIFAMTTLVLLAMFSVAEFSGWNGVALFLLLAVFSFASLPITYLLTMVIDSAVLCFAVICTAGFSFGMCGIMLSVYIENTHVHSVLALIPYSALGKGIIDLYKNQNLKSFNDLCDCATGFVDSPFSTEQPGVGMQLLCLTIEGSILTVLLVCIEELSVFVQLYYHREDVRSFEHDDSDVAKERRTIRDQAADSFPVVVDSISKVLSNKLVLNNVSFGIQRKQCVALLGHNGAGKTTLFSILSGEVIPTFGSVNLFGTSMISDIRGYRERVGYCPQEPATFANLTGREVLTLFAGLRGLKKKKSEEIVTRLLGWTGLTQYGDRITRTYSGGTLRKLSLAISLIGDPPVLLLDEPSASVDPTSRRMLWKLLRQLADSGKSILISTHIKGEVEAVCDKVVILNEGNAVAIGSCNQVKDKFGSGFCLQVSTPDPTEVDLTKAAIEQRLKDVTFVHGVGRHLQYLVPSKSFSYSDVFIAVELIKQLVKLDHYSVCQVSFTQLDIITQTKHKDNKSNLETFVRRVHGLVRRSFKESFTFKRTNGRNGRTPTVVYSNQSAASEDLEIVEVVV